jgi:fatty acid desaturase
MKYSEKLSGSPDVEQLTSHDGVRYSEFLKLLRPNYFAVCLNMILPAFVIIFSMVMLANIEFSSKYILIFMLPTALFLSFWKSAYTLHIHEAGHYNLYKDKRINDYLANIFLTPFVGIWVDDYRRSHWKHHQHLGCHGDTEISYLAPLNNLEICKSLTGVYLLTSLQRYLKNFKNINKNVKATKKNSLVTSLFFMICTQSMIILILFLYDLKFLSVVWALTILITDPFFSKMRQTLEHRVILPNMNIDPEIWINAENRIFGDDFFSKYFGAAGFNKHLIHHLSPKISYTNFHEVELFLMNSKLRNYVENNRTSYLKAFLGLYKS